MAKAPEPQTEKKATAPGVAPTVKVAAASSAGDGGGPALDAAETKAAAREGVLEAAGRRARGWRDLWQIPALALGAALLIAGFITAKVSAPGHDFDGALNDAEALIARQEYEEALHQLNDTILPYLAEPAANREQIRRFHLLRGDAIYMGQIAKSLENAANYKAILEEYDEGQKGGGGELTPARQAAYAECLLGLGRPDEALDRARKLAESEAARRRRVFKHAVELNLAATNLKYDATLGLLSEFTGDPGLDEPDRLWAIAKQAEMRLDAGYTEEALGHLLRAMQRFTELSGRAGGEMYLLLARCYFDLGRFEDAQRQAERAESMLPDADALRGDVAALEGRIAATRGNLQDARDRFALVVSEYPGGKAAEISLLGLAEVEAGLGNSTASLQAYAQVVANTVRTGAEKDGKRRPLLSPEVVAGSLLRQHQERFEHEDLENALNFALLAENLYPNDKAPAQVLLAIARTHKALGERMLEGAHRGEGQAPDLSAIDPVTRAQAKAHYSEAGVNFLKHARASSLGDDDAFGESLWNAGDCYDLAGELDRAIEVFSEFTAGRADDPRQPAAAFRLAQAHMALGDYGVAEQFFNDLIARLHGTGEGARSYVPLAQCYLLDPKGGNEGEAERLLTAVVGGQLLSPDALEFRDALVTLARMRLRAGAFDEAIRRLTEAVERFPDDREINRLRFDLAEANRMSAGEIEQSLREAMPESNRRELSQARNQRLAAAEKLYDQVRAALDGADPRRMTSLDKLQLRNSAFYRADCAFDLGDYDAAIKHYDAAAQRYADDPASLVAMIQIVNAYVAKGAWREAQTANERARQRLSELPENVFSAPDLPLDRRHMERWLESSAKINARAEAPQQ